MLQRAHVATSRIPADPATGAVPVSDRAFLATLLAPSLVDEVASAAREQQRPVSAVALARGLVSPVDWLQALAQACGVTAHADGPPAGLRLRAPPAPSVPASRFAFRDVPMASDDDGVLWLAADALGVERTIHFVARTGRDQAVRLTLAAPLRLRVHEGEARHHADKAATALAEERPELSARRRLLPAQAACLLALPALLIAGALFAPRTTVVILGLALGVLYLTTLLLRAWLIAQPQPVANPPPRGEAPAETLPVWSILVAVYREGDQIGPLVRSLAALDWPESRREIFLVCEEDDEETLGAIARLALPPGVTVLRVPDGQPRTKPRALNFALPLCAGEHVVIYDAEDRPHPGQLREAHAAFTAGGSALACLQAPLLIENREQNWLTGQFASEYDTLFHGLLPVLAQAGGPLPLGGTSNHFRTEALREVGGWDPWNVTEDADLGIRLARAGHRIGVLGLPTLEEAPPRLGAWLRQRTRWMKGWCQTILVHWRDPLRTLRDLGPRGALIFHLVLGTTVLSMLAHPVLLALAAIEIVAAFRGGGATWQALTIGLALFNLVGGYTLHGAHVVEVAGRIGRPPPSRGALLSLPLYWLLVSAAAWRALWQLGWAPFVWEKTQHGASAGVLRASATTNGTAGAFTRPQEAAGSP